MMKSSAGNFTILIFAAALPIASGLHYFIGGEAYQNTSLRNYAVVGQIIFGLAIICYSIWHYKYSGGQNQPDKVAGLKG